MAGQVIYRADRAVVEIGGADRAAFLQGMISNDVSAAAASRAVYAAMLTPQGKFLHDMFVIATPDALLVDCDAGRAEDFMQRLNKYKLRSAVTMSLRPDLGVGTVQSGQNERAFADPRLPILGSRIIAAREDLPPTDADAMRAEDRARMALGVPDSRDLISGADILLECNLDRLNAISFAKGCYVGQELTARTHYRALIKKRLFPVRITGDTPASGAPVTQDGQDAGIFRRAIGDVGLAMLKIEAGQGGAALACGDAQLTPYEPDWMKRPVSGAP